MKRFLAGLLSLLILMLQVSLLPGRAALAEATEEETEVTEEMVPYEMEEFVVANPTHMDGKFFTTMWGNATSDIDVRTLVNDYFLTLWGYDTGLFRKNNAVVSGLVMQDDENGDRLYTFALYDDLYFSDGTPITAWDYAFTVLLQVDPVIAELGGVPMDASYIKGVKEYLAGEVPYISGVHVVSDRLITFTVLSDYLPYFFELFRLGFLPYPIAEIAPGCKVYDDGEGVYLGNENPAITEPLFTKELLEATIMDPDEGYLSHPTVGSGPYVLTSWDGETCTFDLNPYYKGNDQGYKPTIPHLRYTLGVNETMVSQLENGEYHLLNKVTRADAVTQGFMLSTGGGFNMSNYPRIGLTFLIFTPDRPALQQQCVRQAIDYCMDKDQITTDYTEAYGIHMDGMIGLGQWMYSIVQGTIDFPVELPENATAQDEREYEEAIAAWEELTLDNLKRYDLNTEEAIRLLEEGGWTLNAEGQPFDPARDEVRYSMIDGQLVGLDLTCAYPETNISATSMEETFIPWLAEAGIKLTLIPMDMKTLLRSYNDQDIEDIDMFYLGDDFDIEFAPQLFFIPGTEPAEEREEEDTLAWAHAEMYDLAVEMCRTEPHDTLGFMQKWVKFQERLTELLPLIPVYSNVYFDFYIKELQNYDILTYITWGDAIVPAYTATPVASTAPAEGEEEELEDEGEDDLEFEE